MLAPERTPSEKPAAGCVASQQLCKRSISAFSPATNQRDAAELDLWNVLRGMVVSSRQLSPLLRRSYACRVLNMYYECSSAGCHSLTPLQRKDSVWLQFSQATVFTQCHSAGTATGRYLHSEHRPSLWKAMTH
jgi:hypothetical protein